MLTQPMLSRLWPHCDAHLPGVSTAIAASAPAVFARFGLTTDRVIAHAMAQFSVECGAGTAFVEDLDYSAEALLRTWPSRFDAARAKAFAGDARRIANDVYDGRDGNRPGSDDGWTYRGRGASQVTGRGNYASLGAALGLELVAEPDLVCDPSHLLACAVADFVQCGCLGFAVNDDVRGVTYHLNGGWNGLADRVAWLARWKAALGVSDAAPHGTLWLQDSLNRLGASPALTLDGGYGAETVAAVKIFQAAHGLAVDGRAGPGTMAAITLALEAPLSGKSGPSE